MTRCAQFRKTVSISLVRHILQTFWLFSSSIFRICVSSRTYCCSLLTFFCIYIFCAYVKMLSGASLSIIDDWSEESAELYASLIYPISKLLDAMNPDVLENGLELVLLLANVTLSSLLVHGREMWCMSFNLWPSKPPIMYIILLNMIDLWKVLGYGVSPTVSIFAHLR